MLPLSEKSPKYVESQRLEWQRICTTHTSLLNTSTLQLLNGPFQIRSVSPPIPVSLILSDIEICGIGVSCLRSTDPNHFSSHITAQLNTAAGYVVGESGEAPHCWSNRDPVDRLIVCSHFNALQQNWVEPQPDSQCWLRIKSHASQDLGIM